MCQYWFIKCSTLMQDASKGKCVQWGEGSTWVFSLPKIALHFFFLKIEGEKNQIFITVGYKYKTQ